MYAIGDGAIRLRFGAGLNTRASPDQIDENECLQGSKNFDLDVTDGRLRGRKAFDLVATATNGEAVRGFAQLKKQDGSRSTLIQAGGTVYEWDGASSFTSVGTVSSGGKLRGPIEANFTLDDVVIITDLNKLQPVMTWDGTTFQEMQHNLAQQFFAKYCFVQDERAFYFNVRAGTDTPHVVVGSKLGDYDNLSVSDRPSSSLGEDDPFFLTSLDLRPIKGGLTGFGLVLFPTAENIYKLSGSSAKDFSIDTLKALKGVVGDEAFIEIGNNVVIGKQGFLDTVVGVETFGDVEVDDLTRWIEPDVRNAGSWQLAWNARTKKLYCKPDHQNKLFVLHKSFLDRLGRSVALGGTETDIPSPWSVWETNLASGFMTDAIWSMEDPATGLMSTFMGGPNGEIFKFEGAGGQDGGSADIDVARVSKQREFTPRKSQHISGVVNYEKRFGESITLTAQYEGTAIADRSTTVALEAAGGGEFYGGASYYNESGTYYGQPFSGRIAQERFEISGKASHHRFKVEWSGSTEVVIQGIEYSAEAKA